VSPLQLEAGPDPLSDGSLPRMTPFEVQRQQYAVAYFREAAFDRVAPVDATKRSERACKLCNSAARLTFTVVGKVRCGVDVETR
jgi:hypothetical protein